MTAPNTDTAATQQTGGFGLMTALMFVLLVAAVITPLALVSRTQVLSSAYSTRRTAFDLYAFLTTTPNDVVKPIHPKAMPVLLTTRKSARSG